MGRENITQLFKINLSFIQQIIFKHKEGQEIRNTRIAPNKYITEHLFSLGKLPFFRQTSSS